jgi:hypothetical protein
MKSRIAWYDRKFIVILLVFSLFPVGLYGLWKSEHFSKKERVLWSLALVVVLLFGSFQQPPPPPTPQTVKKTQPLSRIPAATKTDKIIIDVAGNKPTYTKPATKQIKAQKTTTIPVKKLDKNDPAVLLARVELKALYQELISFKDHRRFHEMGFGAGNKEANGWLKKVQRLNDKLSPQSYPFLLCAATGYLRQLGMDYMRSKGLENKDTIARTGYVKEGL